MVIEPFCPRLSEARMFLPLLRAELLAAAPRFTLPATLLLDLFPFVEDGLFGYELVPDGCTHTYLAIGRDERGSAVVRRTFYPSEAPSALRLAALNGESVTRERVRLRGPVQQRDVRFGAIPDAVGSALAQLTTLFPEQPRKSIEFRIEVHRCLDEALAIAYAHLAEWDPRIQFCGFPKRIGSGTA